MSGCGKEVDYTISKGFGYKTLKYKCGNTGVDGYPVLCEECIETFDPQAYRENCAANGERIDEDY